MDLSPRIVPWLPKENRKYGCWEDKAHQLSLVSKKTRKVFGVGLTLVVRTAKSLPAVWETGVQSLAWEDPLEKEMATHSSILDWEISQMEEPGRLQSMGLQRVGHDWATSLSSFTSFRKKTSKLIFSDLIVSGESTSQVALGVKSPPVNAGDMRLRFSPWVGKIWKSILVWRIPWT